MQQGFAGFPPHLFYRFFFLYSLGFICVYLVKWGKKNADKETPPGIYSISKISPLIIFEIEYMSEGLFGYSLYVDL